jgi:hypothetical protein
MRRDSVEGRGEGRVREKEEGKDGEKEGSSTY